MKTLADNLGTEWAEVLGAEFDKDYMKEIAQRIVNLGDLVRPAPDMIFNAYRSCPPSKLRVVIIGQDPYPGNEAHGLSFSSKLPSIPPSLRIIFKELERSGYGTRTSPNLQDWADQGVLMLNSILTTTYRVPAAHKKWGWQQFTSATLDHILSLEQPIVFLLWGDFAQSLWEERYSPSEMATRIVLSSCHPQAQNYSGGKKMFVGNEHFVHTNEFLNSFGVEPIKWV
jgi:uracil-DNA glycosylase